MSIPIWVFVISGLFAAILVLALIYALYRSYRKRRAQPPTNQDPEANRTRTNNIKNKAGPRPLPRKPQQAFHGGQVRRQQRQTSTVEIKTPHSNFHRMPGAQKDYAFSTRPQNQRSRLSPPPRDNTVSPMTVMNPAISERSRQNRTRTRHKSRRTRHEPRSMQGHRADGSRSGVRHLRKTGRSLPRAPVKADVEPERIYAEVRW